jgi:hypothetical protein
MSLFTIAKSFNKHCWEVCFYVAGLSIGFFSFIQAGAYTLDFIVADWIRLVGFILAPLGIIFR